MGAVGVYLLAGGACGGSMPPHSIFWILGCGLVISDAECRGDCVSQMEEGCSNRGVLSVEAQNAEVNVLAKWRRVAQTEVFSELRHRMRRSMC